MLNAREHISTPTAQEAPAMGELEPHTFAPGSGAEDESGPAFDDSVGDGDMVVTGVKGGNGKKTKLNRLALDNVQLRGEKRMEEIKIGQVRFRHKCQRKRKI
jgi:hypothetical protein